VIRVAIAVSLLVVLACVGLAIAAVRTQDSMAGVGVVALAALAVLALGIIWLLVGGSFLVRLIHSQAKSLREGPPDRDT
jgi:fermentation-respiration switch protein FrsA (DUF1100 family)